MSSSIAELDELTAARFAKIALGHVAREHPNVHPDPRAAYPIFYGSYDWHSCVHSYWLLATLLRLFPAMKDAGAIVWLFDKAFTEEKVAGELATLEPATKRGFERPYGWAWFLMLQAELRRHDAAWAGTMQKLADLFVSRFGDYLPKATYPIRSGVHSSTAFALALALEYAESTQDTAFGRLIRDTAKRWYADDADCQAWEPSGEDFLSPALTEAECMRRVLSPDEFPVWFRRFLPRLAARAPAALFAPVTVSDRSDGRIVHLDGLNLSRAWCWRAIAHSLPDGDTVKPIARETAASHLAASLPYISGDYMGEHWLASFALLALRA
jgi:hypothetical protein